MFAAAIRPIFAPGASALRWADPWPGFNLYVSVDGVERATGRIDESASILMHSMTVTESRTLSTPNRCTFTAIGFMPSVGDRVLVRLSAADNPDRLFAGTVVTATQSGERLLPHFAVTCNDDSFVMSFQRITGRYMSESVTDIVSDLMDTYAPDFTYDNLEAGLETLDEFTFTNETLVDVLQRLAKRAGAVAYLDTQGDLHFNVSGEIYSQPEDLTDDHATMENVSVSRDISQMVTRVHVEGGGPNALAQVEAGDTILPVQDASWFNGAGGTVVCGPQRIDYDGLDLGGGGGLVGTGALPSSAPELALAAGAGVTSGLHDVTVVFETAAGRSLPSPVATIDVGTVPAPTEAATAGVPTVGVGLDGGTHKYYPVFRTAAGSTTAGPVSNSVTAEAQVPTPTTVITLFAGGTFRSGSGLDTGAVYGYAYTYWDGGSRETMAIAGVTVDLDPGNNAGAVLISSIPTPPAGFQVRWYRTQGGAGLYFLLPSGQAFGQFAQSSSGYYIDTAPDSALGAAEPVANTTAKGVCAVTDIPVSPDALVTHVDMYREFNNAGAGTAKLAFSVANGVTGASDTTANASLGATVPGSNTATANQIGVSDIAIGGSGTIARELYMSPAGGGARKRALAIGNNTATTGTITMSDATLAGEMAEPVIDGSGLAQPTGQVNAGATSLPVAGLGGFPSAGWAVIGNGQQVVRYTGKSSTALTGVPASGIGAITATIAYNSNVTAAPQLTGIAGSGAGSIQFDINKGDAVNLWVTVNDMDAQTVLSDLIGGDGIREDVIQDRRLSEDEARARGQAYLAQRAEVAIKIRWRSRDRMTRAGRIVTVNLPAPASLTDDFEIQQVTMSNFQPNLGPWFDATGSNELFTFEELLRMARAPGRP